VAGKNFPLLDTQVLVRIVPAKKNRLPPRANEQNNQQYRQSEIVKRYLRTASLTTSRHARKGQIEHATGRADTTHQKMNDLAT